MIGLYHVLQSNSKIFSYVEEVIIFLLGSVVDLNIPFTSPALKH